MKITKIVVTALVWLLILALMITPLVMVIQISRAEMEEYATPTVPILQQSAVGKGARATLQDVKEYVTVSGSFNSSTFAYQELEAGVYSDVRWMVSTGEEVQEGQVMGTYPGGEIISEFTGILVSMNLSSARPHFKFRLFAPVELNCNVDDRVLSLLKYATNLQTDQGETVTLTYASKQKNPDGTTKVRLMIDSKSYSYGQMASNLKIYTGMIYRQTVVIPVECVYQKVSGANNPWFVRVITEDGLLKGEVEVTVGFTDGVVICVSGINEGEYCDDGYKAVAGG